MKNPKAPLIGIHRLRMGTDGEGVTTLVAFHGCPLKCRYCLNPQCLKLDGKVTQATPAQVFKFLEKDELYYLATGGGVTFGGGEPLLRAPFIKEVLKNCDKRWHVTLETSLNVPLENLRMIEDHVHEYVVDIKDMNPKIYTAYTGKSNQRVIENLEWLSEKGHASSVILRIPLIEGFNTPENQKESISRLQEMGFSRFNRFKYCTDF